LPYKLRSTPTRGFLISKLRRAPTSLAWLVAAAALPGLLGGCGHPATLAECEELLARSAEIELRAQNIQDPKVIAERTAAFRQARGDELLGQCTGKRITDRAMRCVREAATVDAVYQCLD
jgi:hypothetical protein